MTITLMPEEPSDEMIDDGCTYCWDDDRWVKGGTMTGSYKAMRQHAPKLKPLVWEEYIDASGGKYFCAKAIGITFHALDEYDKADKQADYERRVRELFE